VGSLLVYRVLKGFRTKSGYCEALQTKEQAAQRKTDATIAVVQAFIDRGHHIWRINQVVAEVLKEHDLEITDHLVSRVLRRCFGMRYKRVQRVAF
jgi:transposase